MKTIVIYTSQTGFTKRYAQWIAEAVKGECLELSAVKKRSLEAYDAIVYGGWVCAGTIRKLDWFKNQVNGWTDKKLAVFCVGGSPIDSPDIEPFLKKVSDDMKREDVGVFYCPGGFCYEKMPMASRLMMKAFTKTLKSKKDKTEAEEAMVKMISSSYDISDEKYIRPIVEFLNTSY